MRGAERHRLDHHARIGSPVLPRYETARVLTAAANVLNDYGQTLGPSTLSAHEYYGMVAAYAKQHTDTYAANDTAHAHAGWVAAKSCARATLREWG